MLQGGGWKIMALTSLAWLLPVELSPDGLEVIAHHYAKVIQPHAGFQMYGLEDARISKICDRWLMTTCSVLAKRICQDAANKESPAYPAGLSRDTLRI
jgi:predicted GH43/DUF377 family glycosyl hydrolase